MFYIDVSLLLFGAIITLYISLYNLLRRFRIAINRLFSLNAFLGCLLFITLLYQRVFPDGPYYPESVQLFFGLILLITFLFYLFTLVFPRWEKRAPFWFLFLTSLPVIPAFLLSVFSDMVVRQAAPGAPTMASLGMLFPFFIGLTGLYFLGAFAVLLYKSRYLENDTFRNQLFSMSLGTNSGSLIFIVATLALPLIFNMQEYRYAGTVAGGLLLFLANHYAVSDERYMDFKKFYSRLFYWLLLFFLLLVPAYFGLDFSMRYALLGQKIPPVGIAIILFLYLFFFFRYLNPQIEKLFRREYLTLERSLSESFQEINRLSNIDEQKQYWDDFFSKTIDSLEARFGISRASFYLYNPREKNYSYSYGFGGKFDVSAAEENSDLANCLREYAGLLSKSMFFTDNRLQKHKPLLFPLFKEKDIHAGIPFFDHEKRLIAFLLLGGLKNNSPFSTDFLSVLEIYRIQFELSLANSFLLEEAKATEIVEHDKMVVRSIKKNITPQQLKQTEGIRLSSFYLNNSDYGGDYFDSVIIGPGKIGVFITDTSDAGVDSMLLALEFYTVLHSQSEKHESPEKMLNMMNWVMTTSRYTDKYAPVFYAIYSSATRELNYSNAAFNPLTFFDAEEDSYIELDTKGIPVGIERGFSYEGKTLKVGSRSIGFLYSNGLTSAFNKDGMTYSIGRVKDIIRLNREDSPAVLVRKIFNDFKNFIGDTTLLSDISLIVFRVD